MKRRLIAVALLCAVAACGESKEPGAQAPDAQVTDPGAEDGGQADEPPTGPDASFAAEPDASVPETDASQALDGAPGDAAPSDDTQDAATDEDAGEPDAGPQACDAVAQTGCEAGEKCTSSAGVPVCKPEGTQAMGQACTRDAGNDDCAAGLACQNGKCRRICPLEDSDTCICGRVAGYFTDLQIGLCQTKCNPLLQDCADKAEACFHLNDTGDSACAAPQGNKLGEACLYANDCSAGNDCFIPNPETQERMCTQQCNALASGGCATGSVCSELNSLFDSTAFSASEGTCMPCELYPELEGCV